MRHHSSPAVSFLLLSLFGTLGCCQFWITVRQDDPMANPTDFIIYCNETVDQPSGMPAVPLIWGVGSLSRAPSSDKLLLHNGPNSRNYAGLSASVYVDGEVYTEGPVFVEHEPSYWVLTVSGDDTMQLNLDPIPHRKPAKGIQVEQNSSNSDSLDISMTRYEAWIDKDSNSVKYGQPLLHTRHFPGPFLVFPPVLSLTLTETTFPSGTDSSSFLGQPVGVTPLRTSVTFKVLQPTEDTTYTVLLKRVLSSSRPGYLVSYSSAN